jgi:hypothetical protein
MAATAREFASSPIRPPAKLAPLEGRRYVLRPMAALRSKQTCGAYHRSRRPGRKYSLLSHRAFHQVRLDDRQFARSRRRTDTMLNKTNQIRAAWAAGDRTGALRIAARFFDRSNATKTFKRGMDAHNHPEFYQQLGKKPEQSRLRCLQAVQFALIVLSGPGMRAIGITWRRSLCPLYPRKRTFDRCHGMSALGQNATSPHLHLGEEFP